jgi:hypothetical protein
MLWHQRHTSRFAGVALLALLALGTACSDDSTGPDSGVAGTWVGTAVLPNGFTTTMSLTQNGSNVSGIMSVSGSFRERPLTGSMESDRLAWTVLDGCEVWTGTLTLAGDTMSGPVLVDMSGCSGGSNASGTISLARR